MDERGVVGPGARKSNERVYERGLVVFAPREHDNVGGRRFGGDGTAVGVLASCGLLEEAHYVAGDTAKIALAVGRDDAEQTLAGLLGEVGLLEDALGGVDVGEVEGGARVARVEDGRQPYARR